MTCLSAILAPLARPPAAKNKRQESRIVLRLPQISCNQTHNTFAVSCTAATKDGGSYDGWEVQRGGWGGAWGEGGADKWEKNLSFLFRELMKTDKTRYKVDDCGERPCIKRTNPGRETVDQCILDHVLDSVFICRSVSLCSLIKDWKKKQLQR